MADRQDGDGASSVFLVGFVLGTLVGGIVGLLFAPKTGPDSRSDLLDRSSRMRDRARSLGETGGEMLRDAISEGRDAAGRARGDMEDWVKKTRGD